MCIPVSVADVERGRMFASCGHHGTKDLNSVERISNGNFTLVGKAGKQEQNVYANGIVDRDGRDCDPRHTAIS